MAAKLAAIEPRAAVARAQMLRRERARLLCEVQKKKRCMEQVAEQASRDAQQTAARLAPLAARLRSQVTDLSALFEELLAEGRLSTRAHRQVSKLRGLLVTEGLFAPPAGLDEQADDANSEQADARNPAPGRGAKRRPAARPPGSWRPELESAPQPAPERRSLRDTFRNLARAIHPDQAQHEPERTRRTELMKAATRAYEDGDLARLLELEHAWQNQPALAGVGHSDSEARCRELEQVNRELLTQVRHLTRLLRDAKRAARVGLSPEKRVKHAEAEVADVAGIFEILRKFSAGQLALNDFARCRPRIR